MVFVLRTRENGQFAAEGIPSRASALRAYETAWRRMREATADWAVALYEVPRVDDPNDAIAAVAAGEGLIILHRDHRSDDKALRELHKISEGR